MADDYLRGPFQSDNAMAQGLQRQIDELLQVFLDFKPTDDKGWRYQLVDDQVAASPTSYSSSTNAMIVHSVATGASLLRDSVLLPVHRSVWKEDYGTKYAAIVDSFVSEFGSKVKGTRDKWRAAAPPTGLRHIASSEITTFSKTFGLNDPFTLTWALEILNQVKGQQSNEDSESEPKKTEPPATTTNEVFAIPPLYLTEMTGATNLRNLLITASTIMLKQARDCLEGSKPNDVSITTEEVPTDAPPSTLTSRSTHLRQDFGTCLLQLERELEGKATQREKSSTEVVTHVFPLLRYVQLARAMSPSEKNHNAEAADAASAFLRSEAVRQAFLYALHVQLANHAIPGSEFDIGELVFSLEGLLLLDRVDDDPEIQGIDPAIVGRTLEVVAESHKHNPSWRPLRPFMVTSQGLSHLPVSIEVANSLLRIWRLRSPLLPAKDHDFTPHVELFRRYEEWLRSRQVRGNARIEEGGDSRPFTGWHSEHRMVAGSIDLWETSQVLLFYILYAEMLQRHIADRALLAAGLQISRPARKPKHKKTRPFEYWKEQVEEKKEPLAGLVLGKTGDLRVLSQIGKDFVLPCERDELGRARPVSMLLYGPPGTGKTALAKDLATALRWSYIELSPSDFIAEGSSQVEARARDIFDALEQQDRVVVLFDEIDQLLLDRSSERYEKQVDIFPFMTPSMLTKIKDLHDIGRVIFVIGTNYADRIDPAIKRAGRIDRSYLVMPPDQEGRTKILTSALEDQFKAMGPVSEERKAKIEKWVQQDAVQQGIKSAARVTPLATYGELVGMAAEAFAARGSDDIDGIVNALVNGAKNLRPSIEIESYRSRFPTMRTTTSLDGANDKDVDRSSEVTQTPDDEFVMTLLVHAETEEEFSQPAKDAIEVIWSTDNHQKLYDALASLLKEVASTKMQDLETNLVTAIQSEQVEVIRSAFQAQRKANEQDE